MQNKHGVPNHPLCVTTRRSERDIVNAQLGKRFAVGKAEVAKDEVSARARCLSTEVKRGDDSETEAREHSHRGTGNGGRGTAVGGWRSVDGGRWTVNRQPSPVSRWTT